MLITQKAQYGLRSVFELAKRSGDGPTKIAIIAKNQAIPQRFLEGILSQLRQAGIVESRRGKQGGYLLVLPPKELSVDRIIEVLDGPVTPVTCIPGAPGDKSDCELYGSCVFLPMWEETREAILNVYRNTNFQKLIDQEREAQAKYTPDFTI